MVKEGPIPVYGGNGITGNHNDYNLSGANIIIGRVGEKCGNVRLINGNIWVTDNAIYISKYFEEFDLRYLEIILSFLDLRKTANQAAQPVISYTTIKNIKLIIPPLVEQRAIVNKLENISSGTCKLETIYKQKLTALNDLKKSTLQKAFNGEL